MIQKTVSFQGLLTHYWSCINGEYIMIDDNVKPSEVIGTATLVKNYGITLKLNGAQEIFLPDRLLKTSFKENYVRMSFQEAMESGFRCRPGATKHEFQESQYWLSHMNPSYLNVEWEVYKE